MTKKLPRPGPLANLRLAWRLQRDPFTAFGEIQRRYGEACLVGYGRLRFAFFYGPEATESLLTAPTEHLSWREAAKSLIPVDGDTALIVSDGDAHARRRRLVQPAFATRRIRDSLGLVVEEVDRVIDGWLPGATVDAYADFRRGVRRIVTRSLFGEHLNERADEIGDLLEPAMEFVNRPLTRQYRVRLPGSGYLKALAGRAAVADIVQVEIARRREGGEVDGSDVLGMLLTEQDEDGSQLTDVEVEDQVISLIAAGYDTTSAAIGWAVYALLAHDGVWRRAAAEVQAVLGDAEPDIDALAALRYVDGVVSETLRLYPPAVVAGRKATAEIEVAGYRVPKGVVALYVPLVTQRMATVWPEPLRFEPDRWSSAGEGPTVPHPYAYVPFGGGYRRCIGFALARQEMKVALVRLLQRADLSLVTTEPGRRGIAAMAPDPGVEVQVRSRT